MNPRLVEIDGLIRNRQYDQARDLLQAINDQPLAPADRVGLPDFWLSEVLFNNWHLRTRSPSIAPVEPIQVVGRHSALRTSQVRQGFGDYP